MTSDNGDKEPRRFYRCGTILQGATIEAHKAITDAYEQQDLDWIAWYQRQNPDALDERYHQKYAKLISRREFAAAISENTTLNEWLKTAKVGDQIEVEM